MPREQPSHIDFVEWLDLDNLIPGRGFHEGGGAVPWTGPLEYAEPIQLTVWLFLEDDGMVISLVLRWCQFAASHFPPAAISLFTGLF